MLAAALLVSPPLSGKAYAFKLFGITLFGGDDDTVEVIDPVRYDATLEAGSADKDLKKRLESAAS